MLIKISQVFHREAFAGLKLRGLRGLLLFLLESTLLHSCDSMKKCDLYTISDYFGGRMSNSLEVGALSN